MINFRFHLVSLVAVFLALAVGVVMGYGILGQPTVSGLQSRIDTVEANAEGRRLENEELQADLDRANAALDASSPFSVTDRLSGVSTVVVAVRDVGDDAVQRVVTLARRAGSATSGVVWLESKLSLQSTEDAKALAGVLGLPVATKRAALRATVWKTLGNRLAVGAGGAERDPLSALADAGFLSVEGAGATEAIPADVGGIGTRAVLAVGPSGGVQADLVVAGFSAAAAQAGLPLVVGEVFAENPGGGDRGDSLSPIVNNDTLAANITTVDDLEWSAGGVAAILGLADLGRGVVGHYGYGNGADRLLPEWSQP
jgi:hypothetical protein